MKPIYRQVKIEAPFCPKCGEELSGNNSIIFPWRCSCGKWEANLYPFTGEYEVIPNIKLN